MSWCNNLHSLPALPRLLRCAARTPFSSGHLSAQKLSSAPAAQSLVGECKHRRFYIAQQLHFSTVMATNGSAIANGGVSNANDISGYQLPPPEIRQIVDAPPNPALSFSPKRDKVVYLKRRSLPPLEELARPELKLAGLRIDPECNSRSRMSSYLGITIQPLLEDGSLGQAQDVLGLPNDARINFVSWSPDGRHLGFSIWQIGKDEGSSTLGLWIADVETGQAKQLIGPPKFSLNTIFDSYSWIDSETIIACVIPPRAEPPKKPSTPLCPKILSNEQKQVIQNRTYQDLLKSKYDEDLFDYYVTSQLLIIKLDGEVMLINDPAVYRSVEPSPDGNYLLVTSLHRPYSYVVPCGRFPIKKEVWKRTGELVKIICDLPLAEDIPITFDSVRKGRRSVNWRADKPSALYWVETQDGGDSKVNVSPRDIIYTLPMEDEEQVPEIVHELDLRFGGILWGDESLALVYESWYKTRQTRTWIISPGSVEKSAQILFDRSSEDVYSDPGSPMLRRTSRGTYVLAQFRKNDRQKYLLLDGNGATPEGNVPFLDLLNMNSFEKERIWQSDKEKYYENVVSLMSDQLDSDLDVDKLRILISKESQTEPPQYFLWFWPDKRVKQITNFPHPYPQLIDMKKEVIKYTREDGVQLIATLYLPPNYEVAKDGPLPALLWAYPREFKNKEHAGQMRQSPNRFTGIGSTSALLWLARGFAILDGPTIPIVGEGENEANDSYVEQLVASAEAAVKEIIHRGVAHPDKIAVGGHSYGAFMAANLLAHAPNLFSCCIARAGAYNRTLTPFGFQSEERTLWEAQQTYIGMSPFMLANKISKPILLIHGEEDNNAGTLTMQSERFFDALKGHGAPSRLVLLPHESHGFAGRESVMHVLWEMDRWLEMHCNNTVAKDTDEVSTDVKPLSLL